MSVVTDFVAAQFLKSRSVIGGESFSIGGGDSISAVMAEVSNGREYDDGFDRAQSLDAVVSILDWSASYPAADSSYLGKTATASGLTFRVASIQKDASFVTISLQEIRKGS